MMKYIDVLDNEGGVLNTIIATEEYADEMFPNKWKLSQHQPVEPEPSEPTKTKSVTRRQAKKALLQFGILDKVENFIASIDDITDKQNILIEWNDALEFERNSPIVQLVASSIGLSEEQIDELFQIAASL